MISMTPHIHFDGVGSQPLTKIFCDLNARCFSLNAGINDEYQCSVAYGFECFNDHIENEGLVELFSHSKHAESNVKPVKIGSSSKTVGWLCTIGALTSGDHNYVENKHFRRAAFTAVYLLLKNCNYSKELNVRNGDELKISDLFDEELSILVLHKPSIETNVSDTYTEILPCLHQYGFVPIGSSPTSQVEVDKVASDKFLNLETNIKLMPVSKEVEFAEFTDQVFRRLLPSATTPLLRFFLYYQLIETLLARIFNDRQSKTIDKLVAVKDNPVEAHPLIEKLKVDASDKTRIKLLFNEYSGIETKLNDLYEACNRLLVESGGEEKESIGDALYKVRNLIFHGLRGIPEKAMPHISEIVEQMSYAVPELMICFRIPDAG